MAYTYLRAMNRILHTVISVVFLAVACQAQETTTSLKEIGRTTEKELKVVLSSRFGTLIISKGEPERMVVVEGSGDQETYPPTTVEYSIRNRVGYMEIDLGGTRKEGEGKKEVFNLKDFERGKWYLRFTDAVPISFDVELGVGRGDFNLTGLQIRDFNLSTGASDVSLAFDTPNRTTIDNINIESGVSKFDGRNICNANFKRFRFQGGVGAYTLDFGGVLNNEVDVDLEVGLGMLTIVLPANIGARIFYEKSWVSRLDVDRDFHSAGENQYVSDNYDAATGKMNIKIDSGLGSIKVRRR
jgi:hypothetical protein